MALKDLVPQFLQNIFVRNAQQLGRVWIPHDNVLDENSNPLQLPPSFAAKDDYLVLRLSEMFLRRTRLLWRTKYPVVHAFVVHGDPAAAKTIATVAGPGQLKDLDANNLERVIGLAYRLAGPIVYDGQDVEVLAGLYSVPTGSGARAFIDTVSQLSSVIPALAGVDKVAEVLTAGTERLLNLNGTSLELGLHDTLRPPLAGQGITARPGFLAVVNAPSAQVEPQAGHLWVRNGRLYAGGNPITAQPYEDHDYMLLELNHGPSRAAGFATLPALAKHVQQFDGALKEIADLRALKQRLTQLFLEFEVDLNTQPDLTRRDKEVIHGVVAQDLKERVARIESGALFEQRSIDGVSVQVEPRSFSVDHLPFPDDPVRAPTHAAGATIF